MFINIYFQWFIFSEGGEKRERGNTQSPTERKRGDRKKGGKIIREMNQMTLMDRNRFRSCSIFSLTLWV